jgi:hypothetical protein
MGSQAVRNTQGMLREWAFFSSSGKLQAGHKAEQGLGRWVFRCTHRARPTCWR